jgi:Peptidase MA superfamily
MLTSQGPQTVQVGRVTAVYWPPHGGIATSLADWADHAVSFPGIPGPHDYPIRLVVARNTAVFDSITEGRLPSWGAGAAFPATNTIVVTFGRDVRQILRHELAHLALRNYVRRVPRWLDEGYASLAAGEWQRLDALQVNWALVRGAAPSLAQVNRDLQSGAARADAAYAFATTAVLLLERLGRERGLEPLLESLHRLPDLDRALRETHGITLGQFEQEWRADLRRRYGWLLILSSFSVFWSIVGGGVVFIWWRRRKRDRVRREALNEGWVVPEE